MKRIAICLVALGLGAVNDLVAQCGFDQVLARQKNDPAFRQALEGIEQLTRERMGQRDNIAAVGIPVVVHVLHTGQAVGSTYNPSDATIQSVLDCANERFAGTMGNGVNTGISFCLAQVAPDGSPTTGIDRVDASIYPTYAANGVTPFATADECAGTSDLDIGYDIGWDSRRYYNIYIVNQICDSGIVAYAYLPNWTDPPNDGVYISASSFSCSSTTFTHELGHGMGLYHTFEGDGGGATCPNDADCLADGDKVCDTPPHRRSNCNASSNPCDADLSLWPNSYSNYVSYCGNRTRFTADQRDRMQAQIALVRGDMVIPACQAEMPASAAFVQSTTTTCGGVVHFDEYSGNFPTSWHWFFGDGLEDFTPDPTHVYNASGVYLPILVVSNSFGSDTLIGDSIAVNIDCTCPAPYCVPLSVNTTYAGYGIRRVEINGHITTSPGALNEGGYVDRSCNMDTVLAGSLIDVYLVGNYNPQCLFSWIDWDADGTLAPNEAVLDSVNADTITFTIQVPWDAVLLTPLRFRFWGDFGVYSLPDACEFPNYHGQVEDYGLVVVDDISTHVSTLPASGFIMQPNPTTGGVMIALPPGMKGVGLVEVFDSNGRSVGMPQVLHGQPLSLDLSDAASGIYAVRCTCDGTVQVARLVVRH